jgi:hypothetical protein
LLDKLATFANELERLANNNNYSFSEKKVLISTPLSVLGPISSTAERSLKVTKHRYLTKLFGEPLTADNLIIVRFPLKLVMEARDRERLTQMAREAIVVRKKESYSERVRLKLEHSRRFESAWQVPNRRWKEIFSFEGSFSIGETEVPIFGVPGMATNFACVINMAKCLRWTQKSPVDNPAELSDLYRFFYFSVVDLSRDSQLRNQILAQNPPWLAKYSDPDRYLRQRVYLRIFERFEIELLDSTAGYKVDVS